MGRIRKFLQLSWPDRLLVIQAMFLLGGITLGLRILPLFSLQHLLLKLANRRWGVRPAHRPSAPRIAWAIRVAGRYVPKATCLPQAFAAQFLFIQNGYPADLQIGAARSEDGKFEAHAWVIGESGILIGGLQDLDRFVPLSPLEKEP
jgi:hypothetical protein